MKKREIRRAAALVLACLLTAGCGASSPAAETASREEESEESASARTGEAGEAETDKEAASAEETPSEAGTLSETPAEEENPSEDADAERDSLLVYEAVISQYREAEEKDFYRNEEGYVEPDLSGPYVSDLMILHTQYHRSSEDFPADDLVIGYALADINRDGTPEMFVGAGPDLDQMIIYSVFTNDGTDPSPLMEVSYFGERTNVRVLEDGRMIERGSGGAALSVICFYSLPAGGLEAQRDRTYIMEDGECYTEDEDYNRTPVSEEEWEEAFRLYTEAPGLPLDWVPMAVCRADS